MSSRLRAKSLEEQHHLLRAVQYPNFQLDNVNNGIHQHHKNKIIDDCIDQDNIKDSINQHQHTINNESINQDNIKGSINVIDEDINQYQQNKIHNEIINQNNISDDRISQRKRRRSSTGSIGIASVTGGRTANINHDCPSRRRELECPIDRFGRKHRQHIKRT